MPDNKQQPDLYDMIKSLIQEFCREYWNAALQRKCVKLFDTYAEKQAAEIAGTDTRQCAAAVVYSVARIKYLFDPRANWHVSATEICGHFGTETQETARLSTTIINVCALDTEYTHYALSVTADLISANIENKPLRRDMLDFIAEIREQKTTGETLTLYEKYEKEKQQRLARQREKNASKKGDDRQTELF